MADIARLANVSKITVSRALNDSPLVRADTKEAIRNVAREHGYRFNKAARNLRLRRHHTIAVAFDSNAHHPLTEPFPIAVIARIAESLTNNGYDLLVCAETGTSADWGAAIAAKPVDGVIVIGSDKDGAMVDGIRRAQLPAILCGSDHVDDAYPTLSGDNVHGGELAASRLYAVGRRDLLFLGDIDNSEERQRWEGFDETARRLAVRSLRQLPAGIGHGDGYEAMGRLLEGEGRCFDGLFARNDMVAMGAVRALERAGLSVPGDVSVIGYDDIPMAAGFSPPLTTIAQDSRRTGEEIVARVLALVDGETVDSVKLPTTLVVRRSCA
ncbi:MAG: LacI family DNA-binding transcriptional regulator [Gammaproteobacteria bacterium]|nr:LacI family DNA-binding transcriptional regulator [Gammaproteobacteria bacterium]